MEILANTYKVDAGDLAAEWTAYSFNQKFTSISKENVELFQRDVYIIINLLIIITIDL